jgi:hypothetical protein
MSNLTCEDYSEKAIVVRGESTKTFKEELKQLGGKYNEHLKGGAGWIFSKKSELKVKEFIKSQPKQTIEFKQQDSTLSYSSILQDIKTHFSNIDSQTKLQFLAEVSTILSKTSKQPVKEVVIFIDEEHEEDQEDQAPRKRLLV